MATIRVGSILFQFHLVPILLGSGFGVEPDSNVQVLVPGGSKRFLAVHEAVRQLKIAGRAGRNIGYIFIFSLNII